MGRSVEAWPSTAYPAREPVAVGGHGGHVLEMC